jgi:hypothetical protein
VFHSLGEQGVILHQNFAYFVLMKPNMSSIFRDVQKPFFNFISLAKDLTGFEILKTRLYLRLGCETLKLVF